MTSTAGARMLSIGMVVAMAIPPGCDAQQAAPDTGIDPLQFEVASIRPERSGGMSHSVKIGYEGNGYVARGATIALLLHEAYGIHDDRQIEGLPKWVRDETYSIEARYSDDTAKALNRLRGDSLEFARQQMLQKLLADRFHLSLHRETRNLSVLSLSVGKDGPTFPEAAPGNMYRDGEKWRDGTPTGPHFVWYSFGGGHVTLRSQGASIAQLVARLTEHAYWLGLDHVVVDNTGLKGNYDYSVKFTVPWPPGSAQNAAANEPDSDDAEDMSTAFSKQLGLKLNVVSGPVQELVIDTMDPPTEN